MQGGYGAPPGGYGPAPGGYGQPAGYGPPPQQGFAPAAPTPPKKSGIGLWIGLVAVGLLLLVGIGGAAVYFIVFAKPAPHLARYVPKETSLYVEMPSFKKSLLSMAGIKPLDSSRVDEKQMMDDTIAGFANAFSISQDDARAVVVSIDAAAFAARDTNSSGKAAMVIAFSSSGAAEKLLKSTRFKVDSAFGSGGTRYTLDRKPAPASAAPAKVNFLEQGLAEMSSGSGSKDRLVWFPKSKLLVFGDQEMVTDIGSVLASGADSLEKNESYAKAKKTFESGSDVAFFFDTHEFDDTHDPVVKKMLSSYLASRDSMTGAIRIVKAGVMMNMHATLTGSGMPPDDLVPPAPKLAFPRRLPGDTVAYTAFSTKTKMTGAAVRTTLLSRIEDNDPGTAKDVRDGLDVMEKSIGFKVDDIIDLSGDESAIAILLDPSFKLDTTNGVTDELVNVGLVYALAVKDDAKASMVLGKIRAKLGAPGLADVCTVRSLGGDNFEVDPQTVAAFPLPNLTVKHEDKMIIAVFAGGALSSRAFDALQHGKGTLAADPAHELALAALPKDAHFYMWLDTGRITSVMMDGATRVSRKAAAGSPFPMDAIHLTGPDRVTSALAASAAVKNGVWTIDLDSLNLPAMALFSVASSIDIGSAMPRGTLFGKGGTTL